MGKRKSGEKCDTDKIVVVDKNAITTPSLLSCINGYTIKQCEHVYVVEERQLRAGDEAVSFVKYCKICGCITK